MTLATAIPNLNLDELIDHTQNLIDNADYGPMLVATLQRLLDVAVNELGAENLKLQIDHLKGQLDKIADLAQDK